MSVYLLTWNPKNFSNGGEGSELGTLDYQSGDVVRWSCHSQQPKLGDTVYLIRVGVEPRGIIAKGIVSQESYLDEHWSDATKQKRYIDFKLEELRSSCEQGLLPMMLLQGAMPEQKWSPQTSGIEVKQEYKDALATLWLNGHVKHSVAQFFEWYLANEFNFNESGWYKRYVETCKLAERLKRGKEISQEELKTLWYDGGNGIASVGQGFMYKKEFEENRDYLLHVTRQILKQPNEETYKNLTADWKEAGRFKRILWAVIHRVFAAASPDKFTSIVGDDYIKEVFACLNNQYQIAVIRQATWLSDNTELLQKTKSYLPKNIDVQTRNILLWSLYEWRATYKQEDGDEISEVQEEKAIYSNNEQSSLQANTVLNQILYGPPGTGKTYLLQEKFKQYTSQPEVLESNVWLKTKLEPLNWMQVLTLCLLEIGGRAKVKQLVEHEYFKCKAELNNRDKNLANTAWAALQSFTVLTSKTVEYKSHSEPAIFDKTEDAFWFIVEEKLELVEDLVALANEINQGPQSAEVIKRYSTTTFHQSYGYEEFIEGLRAKTDDDGNIHYSVESGAFLQLCQRAANDPDHRYAMFIDEINRGNISKIFGELITLIEADKRTGCKHAISVNLAYSQEPFSVPSNVDIIGTMNTADRSLAMMDTALRRRFDFIEMMPNPSLLRGAVVKGIDLERLLTTLNERIEILYDREHTLGHAFFMPVKDLLGAVDEHDKEEEAFAKLVSVFQNKVVPLLQEYFFEDWQKIRLVLGDNQREAHLQLIEAKELKNNDLDALFGKKHDLNPYGEALTRYKLKMFDEPVWRDAEVYRRMYAHSTKDNDAVMAQGETSTEGV